MESTVVLLCLRVDDGLGGIEEGNAQHPPFPHLPFREAQHTRKSDDSDLLRSVAVMAKDNVGEVALTQDTATTE